MEDKQITLVNTIEAYVGIEVPELRLKRLWERKGAKKSIPMSVLREAVYYPSVEYLLKEGILYIEDLDAKIELGLESEEARQPGAKLNIQVLKDTEINRLLTVVPFYEFKQKVQELPKEQVRSIVDYAVMHEITDFEKCNFLKELTEFDIIRTVQLNHDAKEE